MPLSEDFSKNALATKYDEYPSMGKSYCIRHDSKDTNRSHRSAMLFSSINFPPPITNRSPIYNPLKNP